MCPMKKSPLFPILMLALVAGGCSQKITPFSPEQSGTPVSTSAPQATYNAQWNGGGDGPLTRPEGIAADGAQYIYVTDSARDMVLKYDINGTWISQWGGAGSGN